MSPQKKTVTFKVKNGLKKSAAFSSGFYSGGYQNVTAEFESKNEKEKEMQQ